MGSEFLMGCRWKLKNFFEIQQTLSQMLIAQLQSTRALGSRPGSSIA
jgi:hypothetical protein